MAYLWYHITQRPFLVNLPLLHIPPGSHSTDPLHRILPRKVSNIYYIYLYTPSTSAAVTITPSTIIESKILSGTRNLSNNIAVISIGNFHTATCPHSWFDSYYPIWFDSDLFISFNSRCTGIFFGLIHSWVTPMWVPHSPECPKTFSTEKLWNITRFWKLKLVLANDALIFERLEQIRNSNTPPLLLHTIYHILPTPYILHSSSSIPPNPPPIPPPPYP